jgi:pSer/pThr/pTyr-binding forkhead associated (FHA) protein
MRLPIWPAMRAASLTVHTPGQPERVYRIEQPETLIGRGPAAHLCVADDSISREHAVILLEGEDFQLEDLQSTNGTRVNGKRVRSARLVDGDEIHLGQTRLRFALR